MTVASNFNVAVPKGYQQIGAFATLQTLTVPAGAVWAVIRCEAQSVRWTDDGSTPTASVGMPMAAADAPYPYYGNLNRLQFFPQTANAIINITYYG